MAVAVLLAAAAAQARPCRTVNSLEEPLDLAGQWRYHIGDLASAAAVEQDDGGWPTIEIPQVSRTAGELRREAVVWFRCEVQVRPDLLRGPEPLALAVTFGPLFGSAEFYANGQLIGRRGSIDPVPKEEAKFISWHNIPSELLRPDGRLVLAARTWQHELLRDRWSEYSLRFWPGLYILGRASTVKARAELEKSQLNHTPFLLIILGISLMFVALHFLLIYWQRRELISYLWYSIMVIVSNFYCLLINRYVGFELLGLGLNFYLHLGALLSYATVAALCQFMSYLLDGRPPQTWLHAYQIFLLGLAALAITPMRISLLCGSLATVAVTLLPMMFYIGGLSLYRAYRGSREARIMSVGFLFFILLAGVGIVSPLVFMPIPGIGSLLAMMARIGLVLSMAVALADQFVRTLDTLDATHRATRRFVPFEYLKLLGRDNIVDIRRGDAVELNLSVLFSDIRSFTALSEQLGPQRTFALINNYLAYVEPAIYRHQGVVSAHLGDGLMALFNADADAALAAAIEMQRAVAAFNEAQTQGGHPTITVGIGINSGPAILGTLGGAERLSCTQISDAVNLAARVEGMTKFYQTPALLTESTVGQLRDPQRYELRSVDCVIAQGKTQPTQIYEVLDVYPDDTRQLRIHFRPQFESAIAKFRAGDFTTARTAFAEILAGDPQDTVCSIYIERCDRFLHEGTPAGWIGVTALTQK